MAIAVIPEEPPGRYERAMEILAVVALIVVVVLFVFAMLDAYVF